MDELDTTSESPSTSYMEEMDKLFAPPGTNWEHRTLRTIFDPISSEWGDTTKDEKMVILDKIIKNNSDLWTLGCQYQDYYNSIGNKEVAGDINMGYAALLELFFNKQ
jgi:hypothetical protein